MLILHMSSLVPIGYGFNQPTANVSTVARAYGVLNFYTLPDATTAPSGGYDARFLEQEIPGLSWAHTPRPQRKKEFFTEKKYSGTLSRPALPTLYI